MPSSRVQVQVTIITDYEAGEFGVETQAELLQSFKAAGLPAPQVTLHNGEAPPTPPSAPPPPTPAAVSTEPAKRKGRPPKTTPPPPVDDTGLADTDPLDLQGPVDQGDDDDGDALGLTPPSMTGQDALESGLGKVRVMYAAGHKAPVKQLQQQFNVASFQDIPPTEGHKFLATVIKLEEQLGLRV